MMVKSGVEIFILKSLQMVIFLIEFVVLRKTPK